MNNHEQYMQRCRELATLAALEGESPVGSLLVKDGIILGEAFEKSRQLKDITRHAEVLAIRNALQVHESCAGATLYTTTEPCILCSYAIRHYRIAVVVFDKPCGELGGTGPYCNLLTTDEISSWGTPPEIIRFAPPEQQGF